MPASRAAPAPSPSGAAEGAPDLVRPALVAFAAVAVAGALGWSHGFLHPVSITLVTLAAAAIVAALLRGRGREAPAPDLRWATAVLGTGVGSSLAYDALVRPGYYVPSGTLEEIRPLVAAAVLVLASWLWRGAPAAVVRLRFPAVLALFAAMGAVVIVRTPRPFIDVWYFQQMGAGALLDGLNPYLVAYPNIYGPSTTNYGPAVLSPDRLYVLGNPYPPLTVLLALPAVAVASDVRWVTLVLLVFSAWAIRRLGRGTILADLAAALLLFQPRTLFVLEQSWTEPAVLATVLASLLAADGWLRAAAGGASARRWWIAAGVAGGVALASKQYAPLLLLPVLLALPARGRWRAAALSLAVAAALVVPFLLWDPRAFVRAVVAFQVAQPFRTDSLSWLAASVRLGGPLLPVWPAFLLAAIVLAIGIRAFPSRAAGTEGAGEGGGRSLPLDRAVLAGAGAWLALVLFNKQAFCNYYWLAVGLACAAGALESARLGRPPVSSR
jgi:uncharacterized membrane protein